MSASQQPIRVPRGRRGTLAAVVALVGVVVSAAATTEAISMASRGRTIGYDSSTVASFGHDTRLGDKVVLVIAIVAVVVGIVVIVAALVPARRRLIELAEPNPNVAAGLTPRSFRRTLAAAARGVDGVSEAKATGARRIKITASTSLRDTSSLPDRIAERVTARLDELNPATPRAVRVVLNRKDD